MSKHGRHVARHGERCLVREERVVADSHHANLWPATARTLVVLAVGSVIALGIVLLFEVFDMGFVGRHEVQPAEEADPSTLVPPHVGPAVAGEEETPVAGSAVASTAGASTADTSTLAGMVAAGRVSSIRLVGDSITAGYLCDGYEAPSDTGVVAYSGPEGTYYETATTIDDWANSFRSYATERDVTFVNAAVSGFRMSFLADDPDAWLADGADVIVVMLGTNDAAKESLEDFRAYAREALAAAAARCGHLVVVSPPDNERTDATNRFGMGQVDQVLGELCAEAGWEHVSLYDVLVPGTSDFNEDQVHPTSAGSQKLWAALRERLGLG